jgi:succinate dehydrogenase/fumarate reductase cytochrome b subunit
MRIRLWPLLASVSVGTFVGGFMFGMADPFVRLGGPTFVSVVIMLSTIAFALFAVLGIRTSVRERHAAMNQVNYWYCTATSVIHALVATYLFWFGAVGLMTWA